MGYNTSDNPPRNWFAGRLYLEEAQRCVGRRNKDAPIEFDHLIDLYEAKVNLLRGVRAALGLAPDAGRCFQETVEGIKGRLDEGLYQKLLAATMEEMGTSIGGTGQYGVPNFTIRDRKTDESADATSPNSPAFQKLLKQAYDERMANLRAMMACIQNIFFEAVYVPGKKYDMFYYHPTESMEEEEFIKYVVDHGFAATLEEARQKYPDKYNHENKALDECFRQDTLRFYREIHDDQFWTFAERHSIRHGFSG